MKYFTKEVKIGLTGIVAIAALFVGLNFLKGINLFQSNNSYYIEFADIKGLAKSGPVKANGYKIGTVQDIIYDYDKPGHVLVEISVDENMRLPKETKGKLVTELLGGCELQLVLGNDIRHYHAPGDTLRSDNSQGLMDKAEGYMPTVEDILNKVDTLLTALNVLATDPSLPAMLTDVKSITTNLDASTRQLNSLLHDDLPEMTGKLNRIGDNMIALTDNLNGLDLQTTMNKVDSTLANVQTLTHKLTAQDNTLGLLLNDTLLYTNLANTAGSANNLLIDLKENPKRYVHFSLFGRKD